MHNISVEHLPSENIRHVDVAILYGLGQKDRAHEIALKLNQDIYDQGWTDKEIRNFIEENSRVESEKSKGWLGRFL